MSACWCADPVRSVGEMYQCPAGDADEECLAHDYLATGGALGMDAGWPGGRTPIPDLADLREAMQQMAGDQ